MPREFECRRDLVLPATPEQVWEAVATRAGNAAWLFPNEIDPHGPATEDWDPPHRFAVREERGNWFNALEYVIEGRAGGTRLRYMHSGVFVDDWEGQFDAVSRHTDFYLHTLGQYLEHFDGRTATYIGDVPFGIQGPPSSAAGDGFERLQRALGLPSSAARGDRVRLATPPGTDPRDGVIDYHRPHFIGVRTQDELYCLFGRNAFGGPVAISIHAFIPGVDALDLQRRWQQWLTGALA